jgi:DNA-binding CsgD family transcriptional regulator
MAAQTPAISHLYAENMGFVSGAGRPSFMTHETSREESPSKDGLRSRTRGVMSTWIVTSSIPPRELSPTVTSVVSALELRAPTSTLSPSMNGDAPTPPAAAIEVAPTAPARAPVPAPAAATDAVFEGDAQDEATVAFQGGPNAWADVLMRDAALSPRERDVTAQLMRGLSNDEAAAALGIARRTVKAHVESILRKTGTRRREELFVAFARIVLGSQLR